MKAIIIAGLLVVSAAASAATPVISGDWGRGVNTRGFRYALTINASESALGQFCSSRGDCWYAVSFSKATCNDGAQYAGLINSVTGAGHYGANHITLVCSKNTMVIKEFNLIDQAVRNASSIGIAGPLESGEFSVSRFSLSGSTRAIDGMRATIQRAPRGVPADMRL